MHRLFRYAALPAAMALSAVAAETGSVAEILKNVASRYSKLSAYEIIAERHTVLGQYPQLQTVEEKLALASGPGGMSRVERQSASGTELRVCDGTTTWKALPKQKVWAKVQAAQMHRAADEAERDTAEDQNTSQDLFTETQRALVTRYSALNRYASTAVLQKSEKVKFDGGKVDCYVVQIDTMGVKNRLFISKESFLVLRHEESQTTKNARIEMDTNYRHISEAPPSPELFKFQPAEGSHELADVSLPSERNMSLVGRPAMDFSLKTVDGSPVRLSDLKGKIVLLDFWATWCPPCRHELPTVEALSRKYKDKNVVVLGINDEEAGAAKSFLEKHHPDLATLHDAGGKVHRLYGTHAIRTVLVINPQGMIVAHFVGEREESELVAALKLAGLN